MLKGVKHEKNQDEFEWTTEQIHMLLGTIANWTLFESQKIILLGHQCCCSEHHYCIGAGVSLCL